MYFNNSGVQRLGVYRILNDSNVLTKSVKRNNEYKAPCKLSHATTL